MKDTRDEGSPATSQESSNLEQLLQVLLELSTDGMFITDPHGRFLAVNSQGAELTGYSCEELLGMAVTDIIPAEDFAQVPVPVDDFRHGKVVVRERRVRRKDGGLLSVEVSTRMLTDGRLLGTVRDITRRKRMEETLRGSEERYRALVESQVDLVSRYRPDTILTFVNDAYCRFFGKTREELVGQSFMFMVAPEFRPLVAQETANMVHDPRPISGEYLNYDQEGKECWIQWIVHGIVDEEGRVFELQAVGRDITKLKQTEEALRRANLVVESSPVVLFLWKAAHGWPVEYVSKNVEQFGYTVEELLAGSMTFTSLVHPDDRDRVAQEVQQYSAKGVDRFEQEYRILTKGGGVRWVDGRTAVERDAEGRVAYYQGILIDITGRKEAEEEREKLQAQLHQAQKMESVGRLAGGVAHDFNNMLTAILGHAQMAMAKVTPAEPIREDLQAIEQASLHSANLVQHLLAFARKQTVAPRVLNLNDTVTGMLKMLQRLIGEDIDFVWMPGADLWSVKIDPSQVDQLLANLCVNARDAIAGVGKITVESGNVTLDEAYCSVHAGSIPGEYVLLAVSDDGRGMDREVLDHIFEPFFTTKEIGQGTGLGLAMVYGIVKQNEGFINVYSEPGRGTTFRIYLPRFVGEAGDERVAAISAKMPAGRGETVLLVEDEESVLRVSKAMLEELGYQVLTASTPGEALGQARAHAGTIQLLLTDVIMPEMNGRDLARLLNEVNPGLKCLFSSGYTANVIAHRGVLEEGVHFLQKPFTREDLAIKVREALERE